MGGTLSEQALIAWAAYVLGVCQDQVDFKAHLQACLVFEATAEKSSVRRESLRGPHYLFLSGEEKARRDYQAMLGVSERAGEAQDTQVGIAAKQGAFWVAATCFTIFVSTVLAGG